MEDSLTTFNRRDIYTHKRKNNLSSMVDELDNNIIKNFTTSSKENNYEVKTFTKNKKYNIIDNNEDKENIIMNPIKQNEKNIKKSNDKNSSQKLTKSNKKTKEMEEKNDDENNINNELEINEKEINTYNNEIESENENIKENKENTKAALVEKLKNIFNTRNKIENSQNKLRENIKYTSDESFSSEDIKIKHNFNDEEIDKKNNLSEKEEKNLSEEEKEISLNKEEESSFENNNDNTNEKEEESSFENNNENINEKEEKKNDDIKEKNKNITLKEKLLLMMEIKKKKEEEKELNEENSRNYSSEKKINKFEEEEKKDISPKKNISGLRNIIDMLKAKKLEKEKIEEKKSFIEDKKESISEENFSDEEKKIREDKEKEKRKEDRIQNLEEEKKNQIEEDKIKKEIEEENQIKELEEEEKKNIEEEHKKKKEIVEEEERKKFENNKIDNKSNNNIEKKDKYYKNEFIINHTYQKRKNSFSNYINKTDVKVDEIPKLIERSFDNGNTYQKPISKNNNLYIPNIGRSKTSLIYTKKGLRGRSNEKLNNDNLHNNSNYMVQSMNNFNNNQMFDNNYNNTNNTAFSNKKVDFSNSMNMNLNNSFQDKNYKQPINQIYCKSPTRYNKPNILEKNYGSSKDILKYNNNPENEYFENTIFNTSLSGINSMTNIHNYLNNNNNSILNNNNNYTNYSQVSLSINLEDLMILEEKLIEIINALNTNKNMHNECFEWWNFYYNCSLFTTIEKAFKREDSGIIQSSIKFELLTLMLCYDISFNNLLLNKVFIMIKALLNLNHKNLLIICEYILTKISNESLGNIWVFKLNDLVNSKKNINEDYISFNGRSLNLIEKIKYNTNSISNDIRIIIKNYQKNKKLENIISLYKRINEKNYDEINQFFRENIIRVENPNASVLASYVLRENSNFFSVAPPYLKTKNLKNYTLVLDLDETIIHFKVNPKNDSEGILRVRPGIFEFLETLGKYYEIIVFTAATQDYADLLIDAIEENKIYFDYRLYRQHAVIIENDFVKDLNRLGRPIDKIIIVDNMPQNFRLQKENGINIRAFWGEDPYDTALIHLCHILVNIANEAGDVRNSLKKYRNEILKKVTSNISKND